MTEQDTHHRKHRSEPLQGGAPTLTSRQLTPAEQMAEDMVVYFGPDQKRSEIMIDYLASLQEGNTKPH